MRVHYGGGLDGRVAPEKDFELCERGESVELQRGKGVVIGYYKVSDSTKHHLIGRILSGAPFAQHYAFIPHVI